MSEAEIKKAEFHIEEFLKLMGQDITREGLIDTPRRFVQFFDEFTKPSDFKMTSFERDTDEMVIVKDIPFYSLCEHHLAPFFGIAAIAYIPDKKMVGLSKLPRTLDLFANRPQNQERITKQIAEYITEQLQPKGVGVVLNARHMCMEMRGAKKHGANTVTSTLLGVFKEAAVRSEFFNLIK